MHADTVCSHFFSLGRRLDEKGILHEATESQRGCISPIIGEFPTQPKSTKIVTCFGVVITSDLT